MELPSDVAAFLNFLGVPWPNINEDKVRAAARELRTFVDGVAGSVAAPGWWRVVGRNLLEVTPPGTDLFFNLGSDHQFRLSSAAPAWTT